VLGLEAVSQMEVGVRDGDYVSRATYCFFSQQTTRLMFCSGDAKAIECIAKNGRR
jgi:hypothetical protein